MSIQLILSILSPLIALLIGFKKRLTLLWTYPLTGLIFDVLITVLKRGFHVNSKGLGNIFFITEFLIISLLYKRKIFATGKLYCFFVFALSAIFIIHTCEQHLIWGINKVGASIFSFTYIVYSLIGFYFILKEQEVLYLERSWFFWLNTALLLYGSGTFFIFLLKEYILQNNKHAYGQIWGDVFLVLNIIRYLLIGVALYYYDKPLKRESS